MIEMTVLETNKRISEFREKFIENSEHTGKYTYCKEADIFEIRAVFGILYLRAAKHLNLHKMSDVFSHESSLDIFQSTMSQNRFKFLIRMLSFDEKDTRAERWKYDKYAAFRDFKRPSTNTIAIHKYR